MDKYCLFIYFIFGIGQCMSHVAVASFLYHLLDTSLLINPTNSQNNKVVLI